MSNGFALSSKTSGFSAANGAQAPEDELYYCSLFTAHSSLLTAIRTPRHYLRLSAVSFCSRVIRVVVEAFVASHPTLVQSRAITIHYKNNPNEVNNLSPFAICYSPFAIRQCRSITKRSSKSGLTQIWGGSRGRAVWGRLPAFLRGQERPAAPVPCGKRSAVAPGTIAGCPWRYVIRYVIEESPMVVARLLFGSTPGGS